MRNDSGLPHPTATYSGDPAPAVNQAEWALQGLDQLPEPAPEEGEEPRSCTLPETLLAAQARAMLSVALGIQELVQVAKGVRAELAELTAELHDLKCGGINVAIVGGLEHDTTRFELTGLRNDLSNLQSDLADIRDEYEGEQAAVRDQLSDIRDDIKEALGVTGAALTGSPA